MSFVSTILSVILPFFWDNFSCLKKKLGNLKTFSNKISTRYSLLLISIYDIRKLKRVFPNKNIIIHHCHTNNINYSLLLESNYS